MKNGFKKLMAMVLTLAIVLTLVPESNVKAASKAKIDETEINVVSLAGDMEEMTRYYEEQTGRKVNVKVIAPTDIYSYIAGLTEEKSDSIDVIAVEPLDTNDAFAKSVFADMNKLGAKKYAGKVVDYAWKMGQDSKGAQRFIPYQIHPSAVYYRRDIAKKVFGTDDPKKIGKKFSSYSNIMKTAEKLSKKGYKIFGSTSELDYLADQTPWVKKGTLKVSESKKKLAKLYAKQKKKKYLSYSVQWSAPWYEGMAGKVPQLSYDTMWGSEKMNIWEEKSFDKATKKKKKVEVFAYALPSWGSETLEDNCGKTKGKWGICAGPNASYDDGTCLGISRYSKKKEAAWEFVRFCALNSKVADWWIDQNEAHIPALKATLKKHKNDKSKMFGGQKIYAFWYKQAKKIKFQRPSKYDKELNYEWKYRAESIETVDKAHINALIRDFYSVVKDAYPELKIKK